MFALFSQRRLRWLGHVSRMEDGEIPKDIFYDAGPRPAEDLPFVSKMFVNEI